MQKTGRTRTSAGGPVHYQLRLRRLPRTVRLIGAEGSHLRPIGDSLLKTRPHGRRRATFPFVELLSKRRPHQRIRHNRVAGYALSRDPFEPAAIFATILHAHPDSAHPPPGSSSSGGWERQ